MKLPFVSRKRFEKLKADYDAAVQDATDYKAAHALANQLLICANKTLDRQEKQLNHPRAKNGRFIRISGRRSGKTHSVQAELFEKRLTISNQLFLEQLKRVQS